MYRLDGGQLAGPKRGEVRVKKNLVLTTSFPGGCHVDLHALVLDGSPAEREYEKRYR